MGKNSTFSYKLGLSFGVLALFMLAVALMGIFALTKAVKNKDHVIDTSAQALIHAEELDTATYEKSAASRGYLLTGDREYLQKMQAGVEIFRTAVSATEKLVEGDEARSLLADVRNADAEYDVHLNRMIQMKNSGTSIDGIMHYLTEQAMPSRLKLENVVEQFSQLEAKHLEQQRAESTSTAEFYRTLLFVISALMLVAAVFLAFWLNRLLGGQIGSAVQDIQSSAAELQSTATQQATGAREQSTAMSEITTTMSELLATSRQIADSAQRVSRISDQTASAAKSGDRLVQRASDSVAGVKRQVDQIVNQMLDLGRKSQQIGGVVEIINELAEQTNILAINANIEAAGAGESGRRFAVVADEIRKLADRVAGSIKDVRGLVDEVRASVNSTIMATETGSKAADAGTRDFAEVANSLAQVMSQVGSTAEAAREIELSTKQQSTAVEQVNSAVANVAQVSRETETSTTQAMQTASELATLSRRLAQLVKSEGTA
jgi:methyl-accepting chemotaxis protein